MSIVWSDGSSHLMVTKAFHFSFVLFASLSKITIYKCLFRGGELWPMQMQKVRVRNSHLLIRMELLDIHLMHQTKELFHLEPPKHPQPLPYFIQNLLDLLKVTILPKTKWGEVILQTPRWLHLGNFCVHSSYQQLVIHLIHYLEAFNLFFGFWHPRMKKGMIFCPCILWFLLIFCFSCPSLCYVFQLTSLCCMMYNAWSSLDLYIRVFFPTLHWI